MLKIPSDLYIWQQLDPNREYPECSTASHLVSEWWRQLSKKGFVIGLSETDLKETKEKIVVYMESQGKIFIPKSLLNDNNLCLDFLSLNVFLLIQDNKVSFAHQSILDCFLAKNIILKFNTSSLNLKTPILKLFYDNLICLERDKDFLIELMNSNLGRGTVHTFVRYLEKESRSIVDYKDIILSMSYSAIENGFSKKRRYLGNRK